MYAPDGKLDTLCIECLVPSQDVLIDAVNKRAVEIEKKEACGCCMIANLSKGPSTGPLI